MNTQRGPDNPTLSDAQVQAAQHKGWNCPATRLGTAPSPAPKDLHYSRGDALCWPDLWLLSSCGDNIQQRLGMHEGLKRSRLPDEM